MFSKSRKRSCDVDANHALTSRTAVARGPVDAVA
jgi:hypothetical protein